MYIKSIYFKIKLYINIQCSFYRRIDFGCSNCFLFLSLEKYFIDNFNNSAQFWCTDSIDYNLGIVNRFFNQLYDSKLMKTSQSFLCCIFIFISNTFYTKSCWIPKLIYRDNIHLSNDPCIEELILWIFKLFFLFFVGKMFCINDFHNSTLIL